MAGEIQEERERERPLTASDRAGASESKEFWRYNKQAMKSFRGVCVSMTIFCRAAVRQVSARKPLLAWALRGDRAA